MSAAAPSASTPPPAEALGDEPSAAPATQAVSVVRQGLRGGLAAVDDLAVEMPIALRYNCTSHVVMMATPADLVDFAYGFSIAEAIVASGAEIEAVVPSLKPGGISLAIQVPQARADALAARSRNLGGRTGCGLCGVAEIEAALRPLPRIGGRCPLSLAAIDAAVEALPGLQAANQRTGAVHAAAFADMNGSIVLAREDVGRHNALDKLIGAMARAGRSPAAGFLVITSRCSMEMVQKAATFGCPVLVAVSAPTALAIELATAAGITVCGFARGHGCTVYSHPDRVVPAA